MTFCCEGTCIKWRVLYKCEWLWSVLLLNCKILFTSDPTLTAETMLLVADGVQMPFVAAYRGKYLEMPMDTYNELMCKYGTENEGRRQIFSEFLFHHPYIPEMGTGSRATGEVRGGGEGKSQSCKGGERELPDK